MSLGSTGLGLAVLRAANAGLGLVLSVGLAIVFGVSREVDALVVAMSVTVFLARDLSRVVRTAAVPCIVESQEGRGSSDFSAALHLAVLIVAAGAVVFAWAAAPWIVRLTSPGLDGAAAADAQRLLRVLAPSLLLFLLFGAAQAEFHGRRRFFVAELGETVWRLAAIAALFTVGRHGGVAAYALALTLAALAQWGLLFLAGARAGIRVLPTRWAGIRFGVLRPFWAGAAVVVCSVAQMQIEGVLDRGFISFMAPGAIALFSYAERLAHMMPLLLSTSLLTPWLPEIARIRARVEDPRRLAKQGSLFLAALGALLGVAIFWAAGDLVQFLLVRGKFDASSAQVVIGAVKAFAPGVPAIFCVQCLGGLYIVERDLKAMIRLGVVVILAHAAGNLALRQWGVAGIALSGSLTVWIAALYLWWRIPARERVWFAWGRFAAALAAAIAVLYAVPWAVWLPWAPARLVVGPVAAWAVYTAVMWPAIRRMHAYEREATRSDRRGSPPGED